MSWKTAAIVLLAVLIWIGLGIAFSLWLGRRGQESGSPFPGERPPPSPTVETPVPPPPRPPPPSEQVFLAKGDEEPKEHIFTMKLRTGARRVTSLEDAADYAAFAPREDLRWERLEKTPAGKSIPFEVMSFAPFEESSPPSRGFPVERAGLIIARAIARQLEKMGFQALVVIEDPPVRDVRAVMQMDETEDRFLIQGSVEFRVEQERSEDGYRTAAFLLCDVRFFGFRSRERAKEPGIKPLHQVHVKDTEGLAYPRLEEAPERSRKAAEAVLARVVKKVLTDPGLEGALVGFIEAREK